MRLQRSCATWCRDVVGSRGNTGSSGAGQRVRRGADWESAAAFVSDADRNRCRVRRCFERERAESQWSTLRGRDGEEDPCHEHHSSPGWRACVRGDVDGTAGNSLSTLRPTLPAKVNTRMWSCQSTGPTLRRSLAAVEMKSTGLNNLGRRHRRIGSAFPICGDRRREQRDEEGAMKLLGHPKRRRCRWKLMG